MRPTVGYGRIGRGGCRHWRARSCHLAMSLCLSLSGVSRALRAGKTAACHTHAWSSRCVGAHLALPCACVQMQKADAVMRTMLLVVWCPHIQTFEPGRVTCAQAGRQATSKLLERQPGSAPQAAHSRQHTRPSSNARPLVPGSYHHLLPQVAAMARPWWGWGGGHDGKALAMMNRMGRWHIHAHAVHSKGLDPPPYRTTIHLLCTPPVTRLQKGAGQVRRCRLRTNTQLQPSGLRPSPSPRQGAGHAPWQRRVPAPLCDLDAKAGDAQAHPQADPKAQAQVHG